MANGQGGARIGAGKKRKPLADKLLDGNPGHRPLEAIEFPNADKLNGEAMPPARKHLSAKQKGGGILQAAEVYKTTWQWLHARGCSSLIPVQMIEQYAMAIARWIQCEEEITKHGFMGEHPTTGNPMQSPYVAMSQSFGKQANTLWYQIYQIVRENCAAKVPDRTPHDDTMEKLLSPDRRQ